MPGRIFITRAEVARMIGFDSVETFARHQERLEEEEGFPLPMPTARAPLKWRFDEVERWVQTQGRPRDAGSIYARPQGASLRAVG